MQQLMAGVKRQVLQAVAGANVQMTYASTQTLAESFLQTASPCIVWTIRLCSLVSHCAAG